MITSGQARAKALRTQTPGKSSPITKELTVGRRKRQMQGRKEGLFLSCFETKYVLGIAGACGLHYWRVVKNVWQGLGETVH